MNGWDTEIKVVFFSSTFGYFVICSDDALAPSCLVWELSGTHGAPSGQKDSITIKRPFRVIAVIFPTFFNFRVTFDGEARKNIFDFIVGSNPIPARSSNWRLEELTETAVIHFLTERERAVITLADWRLAPSVSHYFSLRKVFISFTAAKVWTSPPSPAPSFLTQVSFSEVIISTNPLKCAKKRAQKGWLSWLFPR